MIGPQQTISGVPESLHAHFPSLENKEHIDNKLDNKQIIPNAASAECGWMFHPGLCQTVRIKNRHSISFKFSD